MRPNTLPMLDLSTGHLSLATRESLTGTQLCDDLRITERDCGWLVPVTNEHIGQPGMPLDLVHCLRYAQANGVGYVLFDQDGLQQGGLPWYDDDNTPDLDGCAVMAADLVDIDGVLAVNPDGVKMEDLTVEKTWTQDIGDGDYEAREGAAWIGIGRASVRLKLDDEGVLMISVLPRGREMEGPVHVAVLHPTEFDAPAMDDAPGF